MQLSRWTPGYLVLFLGLGILLALPPGPAAAAKPVAGARYADTDYAFWVNLRVSRSGRRLDPRRSRVENLSSWRCPGLDIRLGTRRRPVRISRGGRFDYLRRRGRFVLRVSGRFRTKDAARISFRYKRQPRRRGRDCDDSGRVTLAPQRVARLRLRDCRSHEATTVLATPGGRLFLHDAWGGREGWMSVVYGCLFSVNEPFELGQDDDDDSDLDHLTLVEPYVAYEHSECPMGCVYSLHVQDLRDGGVRHLPRVPRDSFGQVTDLALRDTGSVAWIARPSQYSSETQPAVWADDGVVSRRLDSGNVDLASLELNGSTLTWVRDGVTMSATLE